MMNFDIVTESLSVRYKKTTALENISLTLPEQKIYGLVGRNGAGKSTFLSILASFQRPTEGSVTIGGETPYENGVLMPHVSFSYERDYSEETISVIKFIKSAEKYRPDFDLNYAEELIDRFNLPRKQRMNKLSKGMQSIVTVVIGLASRASISIFDESYSGMDAPARELFYEEILKEYDRHPRTFILSTHLVSEMDHLFEDVIFLHEGKLMLHESMETITEKAVFVHGRKENVHAWTKDKKVLDEKSFGPTLTTLVLDSPSTEERRTADQSGIEISPASLQDLFIHMTKEENSHVR